MTRRIGAVESGIARGIGFIFLATVFFVCMNTGVKVLSAHVPTIELVWARTFGHLVLIIALFAPLHGGWRLFVTRRPAVQFARSVLLVVSTGLFFAAVGRVPLADALAVSFTAPFMVAALAGPTLGERVGVGHWVVIAMGFGGAILIIRPAGAGAHRYLLMVLGSAACYAGYQLLTRYVLGVDGPATSVTYSALVGTLALSLLLPFFWRTPDRFWHAWLLASLGLFGGLGHYCVARALASGPASVISPFHYLQLVWGAAAGYLVFGDVPSLWTWSGAAVIIASGLVIVWRETQRW